MGPIAREEIAYEYLERDEQIDENSEGSGEDSLEEENEPKDSPGGGDHHQEGGDEDAAHGDLGDNEQEEQQIGKKNQKLDDRSVQSADPFPEWNKDKDGNRRSRKRKKSRLSQEMHFEDSETEGLEDSSRRLRMTEHSSRKDNDEQPYVFTRISQYGVISAAAAAARSNQRTLEQIRKSKRTNPAKYHDLVMKILRDYQGGRPI